MLAPTKPKILIIQTAFIGDVILATSLIEFLAKSFPQAQIDFVLRKGNESIIETNPNINNVYIWDKKGSKTFSLLKILFSIRKKQYDYVINIQRFFNSGLLTAFSKAKIKIGFDKNPLSILFSQKVTHKIPYQKGNDFLHEVQRNALLTESLISNFKLPNIMDLRLQIYFSQLDEEKVAEFIPKTGKYFVLAPSSVWFTKQWHASKWTKLISRLQTEGTVYLIGAPSDTDYTNKLFTPEMKTVINLCGKLSLRQSALLMKTAHRVFVNDSAPLHLASSVNAKVTAIFCSTVPDFGYTPIADENKVFSLNPRLECMPCGLHGKKECPKNHFKCSEDISVEEVFRTIL